MAPGEVAESFWNAFFKGRIEESYLLFSKQFHDDISEEQYKLIINMFRENLKSSIEKELKAQNQQLAIPDNFVDKLMSFVRFKTDKIQFFGDRAIVQMHMAAPGLEGIGDRDKVNAVHSTKVNIALVKDMDGWKLCDLSFLISDSSAAAHNSSLNSDKAF